MTADHPKKVVGLFVTGLHEDLSFDLAIVSDILR